MNVTSHENKYLKSCIGSAKYKNECINDKIEKKGGEIKRLGQFEKCTNCR